MCSPSGTVAPVLALVVTKKQDDVDLQHLSSTAPAYTPCPMDRRLGLRVVASDLEASLYQILDSQTLFEKTPMALQPSDSHDPS